MKNTVIKNESPEMGKEIIKYFKSLGIDTYPYTGDSCTYYGVINGVFGNHRIDSAELCEVEIITLPTTTTQEFKRGDKVLVWDDCDEKFACQFEFVIYIEGDKYPYCVTSDLNNKPFCISRYKNCKLAPQKVKLTLQEIADKFNINVDLIEIV